MKTNSSVYVPIRLSPTQNEKLEALCRQTKKTKSAIVRKFIDKGLAVDSFEEDEARMLLAIRQAVARELSQPVERLAAISAKGAQISSAAYFMLIQALRLLTVEEERSSIDVLAAKARRLGIEYLKVKNETIDDFIERELKRF